MRSNYVEEGIRSYRIAGRRRVLYAVLLILAIFLISVYSLSISRVDISFMQAMDVVRNHITGDVPVRSEDYMGWLIDNIVVNDNAPRTICGICVGILLAVSGAVMQSVTRNPLTDPYTIGISSAAMLGVTIFIVYGVCIIPFFEGESGQIVNAFVFSLIPAAAIVVVSSFKRSGSTMMILIGIAIMYLFNAFTTFIKFNAADEDLQAIYEWGLGTLTSTDWSSVWVMAVTSVFLILAMMLIANRINVLATGDKESASLGENPVLVRVVCFVLISVGTAVAVCYTGTIGFVGLVAPHIARLIVGSNNKILIPSSAIVGALMVVGSDCLVRLLPTVLPVGVITALIGSPVFLYFLFKQRKKSIW